MAIGDDSCSRGHGFESQRRILDEHFAKICIVCLKRPKINEKEAGLAHFLKKDETKRKPRQVQAFALNDLALEA